MSSTSSADPGIYRTGLRNQHAPRNQAIAPSSPRFERLEGYPEIEARMRQHESRV